MRESGDVQVNITDIGCLGSFSSVAGVGPGYEVL